MKKIISIITAVILILTVFPSINAAAAQVNTKDDFRAVWVSTVVNLDFPSKAGISTDDMKREIDATINRTVEIGLNSVVLQVRPCADALYKSSIFPWSEYLTGVQGNAPSGGFDPLAYWIEKCHEKGLELHAWINPYRVSHTASKRTGVNELCATNPARLNPNWVVKYNGGLYFDPGLPECRELIIKGIAEIIENYNVDGIHLDDYFYPGPEFSDSETFKKYGNGMSLEDWRRDNVNKLVKGIQSKIKELKPSVRFGISPFAIWQNKSSNELGSDTNGFEAYKSIYSDTRKWVKEGWLDYICPQIYWYIGYNIADYEKLLKWWSDVCTGTGVDLYIGHAAYKEAELSGGWQQGEIVSQLKMNEKNSLVKGSIFFRAVHLNGPIGDRIKAYYATKGAAQSAATSLSAVQSVSQSTIITEPEIVMSKLSVAQPSTNVTVSSAKGYTILGTCDPNKDLFINGQKVTKRTEEGFFSAYVELVSGANSFTLTQENQTPVTRVITQKAGGGSPSTPQTPVGITQIPADLKYYATVTADSAWVYPNNTSTGGSDWLLLKGQKDLVTARTNDSKWIKLSSGKWIEASNVYCSYEKTGINDVLSSGTYEKGTDTDVIKWKASDFPAVNINFENNKLDVYFGLQSSVPFLNTGGLENTVFNNITSGISGTAAYYSFKFKDNVKIEGYYVEYKNGELLLNIKKRKSISGGDFPLSGFKFVIDAGHGADDTGALGPMGTAMSEKMINLKNALKLTERLKRLGAEVINVRETDIFYTLLERTEISRAIKPDMFISLHANSMAETTDSSNIRGLTVWYRNETSAALADHLAGKLGYANPLTTRSKVSNSSNFYVCRPSWTPSVIIETSFMCNIQDFSWLVSERNQNALADAIATAVLDYYR